MWEFGNRARHARFLIKQKSAAQIVAFCSAKRQTIFRFFRLPSAPVSCPRFSSLSEFPASETTKGSIMSNKPTHVAYIVSNPKEGSDKKAIWNRVGAVFAHKNGNGFDLVVPDGISVTGRIVCTEPKEKEPNE
jgi:hypothetical protein